MQDLHCDMESLHENPVYPDVLTEYGITYSSSVLPANNPLFGWKEFGPAPRKMNERLLEIPITLNKFGLINIPFAGGVYFRCLPFWFIKTSFRKIFESNQPVLSYFHPYDVDTEQEKFMHSGINNNKFYNFLMYYNRKNLFKRLNNILKQDVEVMTFDKYINTILNNGL